MADQDDVRRIALSLPETEEAKDRFAFSVRNKGKLGAALQGLSGRTRPSAAVDAGELEELITDAWRCRAPVALVRQLEF